MITYVQAAQLVAVAIAIGFVSGFVTSVYYIRSRRRRQFRDSIRRMEENVWNRLK